MYPWPPPVMTPPPPRTPPGMTRPTALRSCGAGTGATAASLGVCRPKTIFASWRRTFEEFFEKTRFSETKWQKMKHKKKKVKALGIVFFHSEFVTSDWMDSELSIPSVFEVLQPGEKKKYEFLAESLFNVFFNASFYSHEIDFKSRHNML